MATVVPGRRGRPSMRPMASPVQSGGTILAPSPVQSGGTLPAAPAVALPYQIAMLPPHPSQSGGMLRPTPMFPQPRSASVLAPYPSQGGGVLHPTPVAPRPRQVPPRPPSPIARRQGGRVSPSRCLHHCAHNGRAIIEELLLIERHLTVPGEWCKACLKKHLLTVAALGNEGARLSGSLSERRALRVLSEDARHWLEEFQRVPGRTQQAVRAARQALIKRYYR